MNKVEAFSDETFYNLERKINKFAEDYEIINVALTTCESCRGTSSYKALVLYKC